MSGEITEKEIEAELKRMDSLRPSNEHLTEKQFKVIHYARSEKPAVKWKDIRLWWSEKGYEPISENGLKDRYYKECIRREGELMPPASAGGASQWMDR